MTRSSPGCDVTKGRSQTEGEGRKEAAAGVEGSVGAPQPRQPPPPAFFFLFLFLCTLTETKLRLANRLRPGCLGACGLPVRNNHSRVSRARGSPSWSSGREGWRWSKGTGRELCKWRRDEKLSDGDVNEVNSWRGGTGPTGVYWCPLVSSTTPTGSPGVSWLSAAPLTGFLGSLCL